MFSTQKSLEIPRRRNKTIFNKKRRIIIGGTEPCQFYRNPVLPLILIMNPRSVNYWSLEVKKVTKKSILKPSNYGRGF